jgi:hypothetical protein
MTQLNLFYPPTVPLDGQLAAGGLVTYYGEAQYSHGEGFYICLARVGNVLCRVEVRIKLQSDAQ